MEKKNSIQLSEAESAGYIALNQDSKQLAKVVSANFGGEQMSAFDLPRVRVPAGNTKNWTVPTLEGEQTEKDLEGIIIFWKSVRAAYSGEYKGGHERPICSSIDGKIGVGQPGGECKKCPLAQWGSDPKGGGGQACKQMRQMFLLRANDLIPILVVVPPTSIKPMRQYFTLLFSKNIPYWGVVSLVSLVGAKSTGGIDYAKISFSALRQLTNEELDGVEKYIKIIQPSLETVAVDTEDLEDNPEKIPF